MRKSSQRLSALGIFVLFWASSLYAGSGPDTLWHRTYGTGLEVEQAHQVRPTSDNGYIIVGSASPWDVIQPSIYLVKTNAEGDSLWTRKYWVVGHHVGYSVQQTSDGGYVIAGYTRSSAKGHDICLLKTDENGDFDWQKTYGDSGDDRGHWVEEILGGGYMVVGQVSSNDGADTDVCLMKTDVNGDTVWTRSYGGGGFDTGWSGQQTPDSGYIIAGYTDSFGAGGSDVYLIKTDKNGEIVWTRTYGGVGTEHGYCVRQTLDGGYIVAGDVNVFPAYKTDVYLVKTYANGDVDWTGQYGGAEDDFGRSVQQTSEGGYVVAGFTESFGPGHTGLYVARTNSAGDSIWTRAYGGSGIDQGYSILETPRGEYVIAGCTSSFGAGHFDVYLVKTMQDGSGIGDGGPPRELSLNLTAIPNPSGAGTTITFHLPNAQQIRVAVYDILGREIEVLVDTRENAGEHSVHWDGTDSGDRVMAPGIYLVRLETRRDVINRKVVLVN
jgi:hypothetical protein